MTEEEFFAVIGPRGGIKKSPKAPASSTPNKNPEGRGTSKGKSSTTRGSVVPAAVEEALQKKADDFNERYKEKLGYGVNLGMLKTVYQRGVGAFATSHSPRVSSQQQWAYARVNAFLYIVKNGRPENPKYVNDNDLLPTKHKKRSQLESHLAEGQKHYTADGTLWTGATHKDQSGRLMTGATHSADSQYLYHEGDIPKKAYNEPPVQINLETYRDYPRAAKENAQRALDFAQKNGWGSCGTPVGKQRANQLANGEAISEETIARMASFERQRQNSKRELGDGCGRLMWLAWGGDEGIEWASRKLRQIRRMDLRRQKRVVFNEDFDEKKVLDFKAAGWQVFIRSKRKIKKADRRVYNKLRAVGLSEDHMLFGEMRDLEERWHFDLHMTGDDSLVEALNLSGQTKKAGQILYETYVESIPDAIEKEREARKSIDLKFVRVVSRYVYALRPGLPALLTTSRPFCQKMMSNQREYSIEEIKALSNTHLETMFSKYNLEPDVFLYRGGFYSEPGGETITPFCRHQWKLIIKIER